MHTHIHARPYSHSHTFTLKYICALTCRYTNVAVVLLFSLHYVCAQHVLLRFAVVKGSEEDLVNNGVLSYIGCRTLAWLVLGLYCGTLITTYVSHRDQI